MNGSMRHLLGFTRISNLKKAKDKIQKDSFWKEIADVPRKWYWISKNVEWFEVEEHNMTPHNKKVQLPSIYGVIVDHINGKNISLLNNKYQKLCIKLHNFLEGNTDPHLTNFIIEKETQKVVLIDTEHLPMLIGDVKKKKVSGYISWIFYIGTKLIKDKFFHR